MNNQNLKNTIDQHMKMLPHDVQEAIHGSSWERKILDIGRRYGLHVDQLEVLQTELSLAVLGLVGRDEFVKETMREASITRQIMDLMILDINREIFEPIRNHLKQTRTREETLENVNESRTVSGLHSREEDELRKHGVSLDLEEEQMIPEKPQFVSSQEKIVEEKTNQPILSSPLSIKKQNTPKPTTTVSFQDILKNTEQKEPLPIIQKEEVQKQNIVGSDINLADLPSAKTEIAQNKITESRTPIYQGTDPYREPIA